MTVEGEKEPSREYVKFEDSYHDLLDIEYKQDKNMQGIAALQLNQGYNLTMIHLYRFENAKSNYLLKVFKFENNFIQNDFLFKFSPNIEKAIFCVRPKVEEGHLKDAFTYILDVQSEHKYELGE